MTNRLKLKMNIKLTKPTKKLANIKPARYYQVRLDTKKRFCLKIIIFKSFLVILNKLRIMNYFVKLIKLG